MHFRDKSSLLLVSQPCVSWIQNVLLVLSSSFTPPISCASTTGLVILLFQVRTDCIWSKPEVYTLLARAMAVDCPLWLQASEGRKNFTWKLASGLRCNGGPVILSSMNPTRTAGQSGCLVSLRSWAESQALPPFTFTLAAAACPPGAVSSNLSGVLRVCRKGAVLKFYMYFIKHYICHEEIHKKGSS